LRLPVVTVAPALPLAGAVAAAALERQGEFGWALVTSAGTVRAGTVRAATLAEADPLIAASLREALPPAVSAMALGLYRGIGSRRINGHSPLTRPWEKADARDLMPACCEVADGWDADAKLQAGVRYRLLAEASAALPVAPVHPEMPQADLPAGQGASSAWTVATDGSSSPRDGGAWAVVTGAGWADWGTLPPGTTSAQAEFSAYCRALAPYPDGAAVTLVTDASGPAQTLSMIAAADRCPAWSPDSGYPNGVWDLTAYQARRVRLTVEWRPRNTHPLQATAHHLCKQAASREAARRRYGAA